MKTEHDPHHVHVVINGQPKKLKRHENTFDEIVAIAFDHNVPEGENVFFTVTYRGGGKKGTNEGSLTPGETAELGEGMIINVRATDKS